MKVIQADRDAAAAMLEAYIPHHTDPDVRAESAALAVNVREGHCDDSIRVQAFAEHRLRQTSIMQDQALTRLRLALVQIERDARVSELTDDETMLILDAVMASKYSPEFQTVIGHS